VKKSVRLEFLCGGRAVRRARADLDLLSGLAARYSAAADELPALVEAQRAELKAATAARRELEKTLAAARARELYEVTAPDGTGLRRIVVREELGPAERLRPLAEAVCALPRALFAAWTAVPPALLVAASADAGVDAGALVRSALSGVGGRGGGSPRIAQGTAPSAEAVERAVAALLAAGP
jgi:alanyl-tRNA synthetase